MKTTQVHALDCVTTEDWSGADTCRLEITVDGDHVVTEKADLNNGGRWHLNKTFNFDTTVELVLWEEDWPDSDDVLGKVEIGTGNRRNATAVFQRDGADYRLRYSVSEAQQGSESGDPKTRALRAIDAFDRASGDGVWPNIQRSALVADMKARVRNPFAVNQRSGPFCGPATIVFELVRRSPDQYVNICRALYETGSFQSRTKEVRPSDALRRSRIGGRLGPADWMLMGTLRDTENMIFDVEGSDQQTTGAQVTGITTPWEMKGWATELLGCNTVDYHSTAFYGEFEAMRQARQAVRRGGVAFLMINSSMLKTDPDGGIPNHFIVFLGNLEIEEGVWFWSDSGHIKFDCYSWGRRITVDVNEGVFEECMWGVVVGS